MKKQLLLLALGLGLTSSAWALEKVDGVYQIGTAQDLVAFASLVNSGTTSAKAVLTDDIDMSTVTSWEPIGYYAKYSKAYNGTFDGQNHSITGLTITATEGYQGLFGSAHSTTIKNFSISGNIKVTSSTKSQNCGVIGNTYDTSTISNVISYLNLTTSGAEHPTGGLVGWQSSGTTNISNCAYYGTLIATGGGTTYGGIIGYVSNSANIKTNISNTIFGGTVSTTSTAGGFIGYTNGAVYTFNNCLSYGTVSATTNAGMFFGIVKANKTITNCYYLGSSVYGNESTVKPTAISVTTDQLASGEIAYKLNGSKSGGTTFYQTLSSDDAPTLDATHEKVYTITSNGTIYCNYESHNFSDHFCTACGAADSTYMTPVDGYYEIANATQLKWFAAYVNTVDATVSAKLTADIDLNCVEWTPIGDYGTYGKAFTGTFDGQGYTITNLNMTTTANYKGLFGMVTKGADIKNFTIYGTINVDGGKNVGVVGYAYDDAVNISNIQSYLNFKSTASDPYIGGIIGSINRSDPTNTIGSKGVTNINRCAYHGTITMSGTNGGSTYAGIVGYVVNISSANCNVKNCIFDGTIVNESSRSCNFGGIVGYSNGATYDIENCLSIGTLTTNDKGSCGMFFGAVKASKTFTNNYYIGDAVNGSTSTVTLTATSATTAQLASGEICMALNGNTTAPVWRQNLTGTTDDNPVLDDTHGIVNKISSALYTTQYITSTDVTIPEGVTAYTGTLNTNSIHLNEITTGKIAAKEPVILKKASDNEILYFSFIPTTDAEKAGSNCLSGSDGNVTGGDNIYALSNKTKGVGFYKVASTVTIPAGKAYLNTSAGTKEFFGFGEDDATAINGLTPALSEGEGVIYNLAGQRINKMQRGINIVNGKKVLK